METDFQLLMEFAGGRYGEWPPELSTGIRLLHYMYRHTASFTCHPAEEILATQLEYKESFNKYYGNIDAKTYLKNLKFWYY